MPRPRASAWRSDPARSRSTAPIPPTPSPRKPVLPVRPTTPLQEHIKPEPNIEDEKPTAARLASELSSTASSATRQIPAFPVRPSPLTQQHVKPEPRDEDEKPPAARLTSELSSTTSSATGQNLDTSQAIKEEVKEGVKEETKGPVLDAERYRSLAPEPPEEDVRIEGERQKIKDEAKEAELMERIREIQELDEEMKKNQKPLFVEEEESSEEENRDEGEQDHDGMEVDYGDDPDAGDGGSEPDLYGSERANEDEVEVEENDSEYDEAEEEPLRRSKRKKFGSLISKRRVKRPKRAQRKREAKRAAQEKERERLERELAEEVSGFLDGLGVDPRPTLLAVKARLTNSMAAITTNLPAPHQVLAVKVPPPRPPKTPTPSPPPSPGLTPSPRRARSATLDDENAAPPQPGFDDLVDYEDPEEYLQSNLPEFKVVVEKPKQLKTKLEAISRWEEETNLRTSGARPIPDAFSWKSYSEDHTDLTSFELSLDSPLPPLLTLPRALEAHPTLISSRPPATYNSLIWESIFDPTPPEIDSDSRQARANWQLSNFRDEVGLEKMLRDAKKEGVTDEDYKLVAKEVFEVPQEKHKFKLDKVAQRNWLFAEQIVQLARVQKAYRSIASPGVLLALSRLRQFKQRHFKGASQQLERARAAIPETVWDSTRILDLKEQIDRLKFSFREVIEKIDRLEKNLNARLEDVQR